jgi:Pin2-interacting protein X1
MGLAETKRKQKLAPSNFGHSSWSDAAPTSSVGFKLMSTMGWAPGQGLGNDLQGEKNTIKYALKDDFLGIGAKKEYGGGLWRGTGEVDDLYRRLEVGGNKPTEEVVEVKEGIKEVKKVRNGWQMKFQVGDIYTSSFSQEGSEVEGTNSAVESSAESSAEKKSKKRKREDDDGEKKKEERKEESNKNKDHCDPKKEDDGRLDETSKRQKSKEKEEKLKRKMEKKARNQLTDSRGIDMADSAIVISPGSGKDKFPGDKAKDKKEKIKEGKKEGRREGKERKKKKESKADKESSSKKKRKDKPAERKDAEIASEPSSSNLEQVAESIELVTESTIPRHMHRARFLAMKRASVMDQKSLREILGVTG